MTSPAPRHAGATAPADERGARGARGASAGGASGGRVSAGRAPVEPASVGGAGTTVHFTQAARLLAREARRHGLSAPGFRCPPRVLGVQRTIRRHHGSAVVAVQVRGRPWGAVVADMIEGVVVTNRLAPPAADRLRTDLWEAIGLEWPSDLGQVA